MDKRWDAILYAKPIRLAPGATPFPTSIPITRRSDIELSMTPGKHQEADNRRAGRHRNLNVLRHGSFSANHEFQTLIPRQVAQSTYATSAPNCQALPEFANFLTIKNTSEDRPFTSISLPKGRGENGEIKTFRNIISQTINAAYCLPGYHPRCARC